MTRAEEYDLVEAAQQGDTEAIAFLVQRNTGCIRQAVHKMHPADAESADDLFQEGAVGVLEAIRRFDRRIAERTGAKFFTYALYWVRLHVQRGADRLYGPHLQRQDADLGKVEARPPRPEPTSSLLRMLPDDEREVVRLHYGLDGSGVSRPLDAVAARLGISREQAFELHKSALSRFRRELLINPNERY